MTLSAKLSDFWHRFQGELFPALAEEVGPLLGTHRRFVAAAEYHQSSTHPRAAWALSRKQKWVLADACRRM